MATTPERPPADPRRRAAERRGHGAERLSAWALRLKGYRILGRRVKTPHGEIDLVALKGDTVAIVEVKARADADAALAAIGPGSQRRLSAAARVWLARNPAFAGHTLRFDVVLVVPRRWPTHLPNAFAATD
jgi:putative endonuclease